MVTAEVATRSRLTRNVPRPVVEAFFSEALRTRWIDAAGSSSMIVSVADADEGLRR